MEILELLKVIFLGIVEGVTEWLPISSTGHMILVDEFLKLDITPAFREMFFVVIQLGAIFAVVVLFWHKIWPFGWQQGPAIKKDIFSMWFKIAVACIPAVVGIIWGDLFEALFDNWYTVAIMLIIFGILFIVVEAAHKNKPPKVTTLDGITYPMALFIGVFQLIAAILPGTSRSGATIVAALLIGISRPTAAEFTFFLAIPTMAGASLLKLLKFGFHFRTPELIYLIVGMVTAFAVSMLAIGFLMDYVKKHDFKVFGWYRIILGIVVLIYFGLVR